MRNVELAEGPLQITCHLAGLKLRLRAANVGLYPARAQGNHADALLLPFLSQTTSEVIQRGLTGTISISPARSLGDGTGT